MSLHGIRLKSTSASSLCLRERLMLRNLTLKNIPAFLGPRGALQGHFSGQELLCGLLHTFACYACRAGG